MPGLGIAAATALVLLLPWLWPMYKVHREHVTPRPVEIVKALSAEPTDWLTTQSTTLLPLQPFESADFPLLPGPLRSVFALASVGIVASRRRYEFRFLSSALVISWVLSFGANIELFGWNGWDWFASRMPGMGGIRSPYRFAYITQLAALLLASMTVSQWCRRLQHAYRASMDTRVSVAAKATIALLLFILAFEVWPCRSYITFPPHPSHEEAWIEFLKNRDRETDALLCLPVASNASERANQIETLWMMYGTLHRLPILNGYSGFSPAAWSELQKTLRSTPLSASVLEQARQQGATLIAIRRGAYSQPEYLDSSGSPLAGTQLIFLDDRYAILSIANQGP